MFFAPLEMNTIVVAAVTHVAMHLIVYKVLLALRVTFIRTERGIFLYHLLSFLLMAAILPWLSEDMALSLMLAVGLHGLYSLSFLEVWSLTQGSYSLSLIEIIHRSPAARPETITASITIGAEKTQGRTEDLAKMGLVRHEGTTVKLTAIGKIAALIFGSFLRFTNGTPFN
jgi:hypothetical protein